MRQQRYWGLGLTWLGTAIALGATGMVARMRPPAPQLLIVGLVAALVAAYARGAAFRTWADRLPLRTILAFHLTRFVGIYFLVLYSRGALPYAFAVPGGWGDIITAIGAIGVMAATDRFEARAGAIWAWNTWGTADILMVVVSATRQFLADPASMRALLVLPLSLLPTFLVPLIIASHLLVFRRLVQAGTTWR